MVTPVTTSTGQTFDFENINKWLNDDNNTCPVTKNPTFLSVRNRIFERVIEEWAMDVLSKK